MKYFLFICLFVYLFISCDNVHRTERKVLENGKIEKSGDSFKFTCEKNYKLCRKDDDKYTCTNIENTIKKTNKKTLFKCFSLTDPETCLDGNPCHVPNRKSAFYKDLTDDQFEQRVKDSLDIKCYADYDSGNNSKGNDKSTCEYKCHTDKTHKFIDCNSDLIKLNTASEGNGCETDLNDDTLHINSCPCDEDGCKFECKNGYCNDNGDLSTGCEYSHENPKLHLNGCRICKAGYFNLNGDWSDGCEFDCKQPELHFNGCPTKENETLTPKCLKDYCDVDGILDNGCEFNRVTYKDHENNDQNTNLNSCPVKKIKEENCKWGFCDLNKDNSDGCEFYRNKPELHLNSCHSCAKDEDAKLYLNSDGDWSNGCEVKDKIINQIYKCSDEQIDCSDRLSPAEKELYNPTCTKEDEDSDYQCGKSCKAKKCGDNCCALDQVCGEDGKCGCTIGDVKPGCKNRSEDGLDIGTHVVCKEDGYKQADCSYASCNGNKCGECLNGSSNCLLNPDFNPDKDDYNKSFNIRQRCVNGRWSETIKRTDCTDCRVYICTLPDEV